MTDLADLPFTYPSQPTSNGATGRPKCKRHDWVTCGPDYLPESPYGAPEDYGRERCHFCGVFRDPVASRRGRSASRLGKDQERRIERVYGPRKVGEFGDAVDHLGRDWKWQAKSTRSLPPKWLAAITEPTWRPVLPKSILGPMAHMEGIGGARRPLVIRSYVRRGGLAEGRTQDWLFVTAYAWAEFHERNFPMGHLAPIGFLVIPGADFLEIHGRDSE